MDQHREKKNVERRSGGRGSSRLLLFILSQLDMNYSTLIIGFYFSGDFQLA